MIRILDVRSAAVLRLALTQFERSHRTNSGPAYFAPVSQNLRLTVEAGTIDPELEACYALTEASHRPRIHEVGNSPEELEDPDLVLLHSVIVGSTDLCNYALQLTARGWHCMSGTGGSIITTGRVNVRTMLSFEQVAALTDKWFTGVNIMEALLIKDQVYLQYWTPYLAFRDDREVAPHVRATLPELS